MRVTDKTKEKFLSQSHRRYSGVLRVVRFPPCASVPSVRNGSDHPRLDGVRGGSVAPPNNFWILNIEYSAFWE